jgi:hypothetical protein
MTLLYMDGFETQDATRYVSGATIGYGTGTRFSYGHCVDVFRPQFNKPIGSNETTLIVGQAVKTNNYQHGIYFYGDNGTIVNVVVVLLENGAIDVRRTNTAGTLLASAPAGSFPTAAWFYVEAKIVFSNTVGTVEVRINGANVASATGLDTNNSTTVGCDMISVITTNAGGNRQIDDFYICNGSGSVNNNFLGDVRVATLAPTGNGASSQLAGSDGNSTDNYLLVDESPYNTSDYVSSATSGQKDSYVMADLPGSASSVLAVQQVASLIKTDAGAIQAKHLIRSGATNYTTAAFNLSTGYVTYLYIRETDPDTSAAWTVANVNAHEAGIEVA